jgi:uncharacterized protein (DUF1697 family)
LTAFVALLRAVNVGGTGKLAMNDLRALCEAAGLCNARTFIASGNVVFESDADEPAVKSMLERALEEHAGKPMGAMVRTGPELTAILAANPFPKAPPNRALVVFLDAPPPADALAAVTGQSREEIALGAREIYVHYADGVADSKLKIPAARAGTARNLNTVAKLAEMAGVRTEGTHATRSSR